MNNLLVITFAHYVGDYVFQGDFLAQSKGKYWYSLFAHSFLYAMTIGIAFEFIGVFAMWKLLVLLVSHMIIDYTKANAQNKTYALTRYLYIDQALHMIINVTLMYA